MNSQNLQTTLRRALFKSVFKSDAITGDILMFFERLESELPTVNTLQRNVGKSYFKAVQAFKKYETVQSFQMNAEGYIANASHLFQEGLLQNDESSIIFIESITQYYQTLDILEILQECLQLRLDFHIEHLIVDCIMYGILANDTNLDPRMEQLERVFSTYLQFPHPEVRERILRKIYSKLRLQSSLQTSKKFVSNIQLLSKFLYRKGVLNQLINGMLINSEISSEESRLQMTLGCMIIKILIVAFNESGVRQNLNTHFLTFHSLMRIYPDVIGLIDLIEENTGSKSIRFHRLLRDLYHIDQSKREFATSVLRNNFTKDCHDSGIKDLVGDSIDIKHPCQETSLEFDAINHNYETSTLDIMSIQSILMSTGSDYMIKKSCLEQLSLILFDVTSKRGKVLFKDQMSSGSRDLFSFLVNEIICTFNTCQGYLRQSVSLMELSHQSYISDCLRFIYLSSVLYSDETVIKSFFGKLKQLYQEKEKQDTDIQVFEQFLNAIVFFAGSVVMRNNALKVLFTTVFQPVMINTKISKNQLPSGAFKKTLNVYIAQFCCDSFIIVVPHHPQPLKQPLREDLALSEEQQMYVSQRVLEHDQKSSESEALAKVSRKFIEKVQDKNENFNNVMREFEQLQCHVLALQQMRDELVNPEVLLSMIELMKVLPTRDFEFSFLSDYFMSISQIMASHRGFIKHPANLQLFINRICDALKFHLLPFLIESGFQLFNEALDEAGTKFSPRAHFIQRFLELINNLLQTDLFLQQQFRMSSGIQDRLLQNPHFIDYMLNMYAVFKPAMSENRRKILIFISTVITYYDTRPLKFDQITEVLIGAVATHKLSLLFTGHSILMLGMRTMILIHQRRLSSIKQLQEDDHQISVSLNKSSVSYLQKFQSFGWILRFIECRDSRIRVLAWDLITEIFDYDFLKSNPSVVQNALNTYLKHQELFSVKISVLKFLCKVCDSLMLNCDVFRDFEISSEGSYLDEAMSVKLLLQMVSKQGLISQMHVMLSQKDTPLLFVSLTIKLLHKLVLMDHKRTLSVLTQLDYWTFLVDFIQPKVLEDLEGHENRNILVHLKKQVLATEDPCKYKDMVILTLNAIIEFIFEGFKRDSQLANMLVKTTKLMGHMLDTVKTVIDSYNFGRFLLVNKNLVIIFIEKIIKLLHVSLLHPKDYTIELISKFLFDERVVNPQATYSEQVKQRNWVYITEMFRIINSLQASCSYIYGQIEVKLALSRFIAELLLMLKSEHKNYLDEMVSQFDSSRYFDENEIFSKEELRTYGSLIFVEMGLVFKGLYLDRNQAHRSPIDSVEDNENQKIDITNSSSAKTIAIEQNLTKKIIEICQENVSALHLADLQKLTSKGSQAQKSVLGKSSITNNSALVQSVFESQIKRQYKYAQYTDVELCQRETIRMLQILRHLFFGSNELLISYVSENKQDTSKQSKVGSQKKAVPAKHESIGEKLTNLWAQIMSELELGERYNDIIVETLRCAITFSSQCNKYKNIIATNSIPNATAKKSSLLKLCSDRLLIENPQGNSLRMKLLFILLRSLSMGSEVAKEIMKQRTIEDILDKIHPLCKNEKDIKLMKNFLCYFFSFIAGFSSSEDGQKILLKLKELYELTLFILDTVTPQTSSGPENKSLSTLISNSLLFLRNTAFNRSNKLHFMSNPQFLPCLLAFISSQQMAQQPKIKAYAAACLWIALYNHQGVKAALNRPEVLSEMQLLKQEYQRQTDIENYQFYVVNSGNVPQDYNSSYVLPMEKEDESYSTKKLNEFTHVALTGILGLLQQAQ